MQTPKAVLRLKSFSGDCWHIIDLNKRTCDCREFIRNGKCEHLTVLGVYPLKPFTPSTHPTFSQALSGLVKSLRIRRVEDAVYWLMYLDTFPEAQHRFRTARRLLIGSAEDGHSVAVMERVSSVFRALSKPSADLSLLVAEAIRICKLPNWWDPRTGGPDYLYSSLVGQRYMIYSSTERSLTAMTRLIEQAIDEQNTALAMAGVQGLVEANVTSSVQAELLKSLAQQTQHALAERLVDVHLKAKTPLSGDNNFISQALWMMAGGVSPIAEAAVAVSEQEVQEMLESARERWKNPSPIPTWCCDGVHCAGNDLRFAGMLPLMFAVCLAYEHYGRVDPQDKWLPQFRCLDGLILEDPR